MSKRQFNPKSETRHSHGAATRNSPFDSAQGRQSKGFTLVELLVVIAIISLLAGILLPSLNKAKERTMQAACAAKMRAWGVAVHMYISEYNGKFPLFREAYDGGPFEWETFWVNTLAPYMGKPKRTDTEYLNGAEASFRECPTGEGYIGVHYGFFDLSIAPFIYGRDDRPTGQPHPPVMVSRINEPSTWIMMLDLNKHYNSGCYMPSPNTSGFDHDEDEDGIPDSRTVYLPYLGPYNNANPKIHYGGSNVALCDGHVEWIPFEIWQNLDNGLWTD